MRLFLTCLLVTLNTLCVHAQPCGTYEVSFGEELDIGGPTEVEYHFYPVCDTHVLYLAMETRYRFFADKLSFTKDKYDIRFVDGSIFHYDAPYRTNLLVYDMHLVLKGWVLRQDVDTNGTVISEDMEAGDTALLHKLLTTPIHSISLYSATVYGGWWQRHTGKQFSDYEGGEPLLIPRDKATQLMKALQCLVKNINLPDDPVETPGGLKIYHPPAPRASKIKVMEE